MRFYDLKTKRIFETSKYDIVYKKGKKFAVAKSPSGLKAWRLLAKERK